MNPPDDPGRGDDRPERGDDRPERGDDRPERGNEGSEGRERGAGDEELAERLDALEASLEQLRGDLHAESREGTWEGPFGLPGPPTSSRPPRPPRPPRLSELIRFTEQYTIPTLIAILEATIKSLELLRGTLRLADPNRGLDSGSAADAASAASAGSSLARDRLSGVRADAERGLARSLTELQRALERADLPDEAASRSVIEDARELSAEIESRIAESQQGGDGDRASADRGSMRTDDPKDVVHIEVQEPDATADTTPKEREGDSDVDTEEPENPEVDVESELESIRREVNGDEHEKDESEAEGPPENTDDGGSGDSEGNSNDSAADHDNNAED